MKFYCFGDANNPIIMLLPGTCCHWKRNFGRVIPLLFEKFHVICVSYDGFDETENTTFPDMITETSKIEKYITSELDGKIFAAYGCSLGGSFVGLLIQRRNVHIEHGFIGSSDLDQSSTFAAKIQAAIVAPIMAKILQTGELPKFMQKRLEKKSDEDKAYTEKMLDMMGVGEKNSHISKKSVYNQFYSDLITPSKMIFMPTGRRCIFSML
ncbi:MAG: alpha/beta fold hydrolase [Oscillospiraceae bacterium]